MDDNMQWLMATASLEEELTIERAVRAIYHTEDIEEVQGLCASLIRQNFHQRKLLCEAVNKIVEMEVLKPFSEEPQSEPKSEKTSEVKEGGKKNATKKPKKLKKKMKLLD